MDPENAKSTFPARQSCTRIEPHSIISMESSTGPYGLLLEHIPASERATILKSLIGTLRPTDDAGINFVASLVQQCSDQDVKEDFLEFLQQAIQAGAVRSVVSVSLQHAELGQMLLQRAADVLSEAKSPVGNTQLADEVLLSYLQFLKLTASELTIGDAQSPPIQPYLTFVEDTRQEVHVAAKDLLFTLLATKNEESSTKHLTSQKPIWQTIKSLVVSKQKEYSETGYSLWLRVLLAVDANGLQELISDEYWEGIITGLRQGDVERRKICLNILKLSIATDTTAVSGDTREQLERYCTVFETVVLGRYINQIQECENDLESLATNNVLDQRWLITLLASSLENRMLDSIRRFIGNWIMRAYSKSSPEFLGFFQNDFLPWVTQGQLFVGSLKSHNGQTRCLHGERLSNFIKRIRIESSLVVDIIVDAIMHKRNAMFAYCTVYLIDGLGDALQSSHRERLLELSGFPEVARDYMFLKTSNASTVKLNSRVTSRREAREEEVAAKMRQFEPSVEHLEDVWAEIEYLEFPKRLVISLPDIVFAPAVLNAASEAPTLAVSVGEKFRSLQRLTETKTFLFAPLVLAVRKAAITIPQSIEVLDVSEFILRMAENPPEQTIDLMLEEAIIPLTPFTYRHYFGEPRSYGFAAYFDLVSRLAGHQELIEKVLYHILERWKTQKVPPLTVSAWKTALQLQVLLLCLEQYKPKTLAEVNVLLDGLLHILAIEPLPGYRFLLEWIVVRLVMQRDLGGTLIERLNTKDHHSNSKHIASLMKIGTILACTADIGEDFARQLATTFISLAASSKVVIRHEAQWQIPILMDYARTQPWETVSNDTALGALDDYIRSLERFNDPPLERQIGKLDPVADHTLSNLVEGSWHGFDQAEAPLTTHDDFLKLYSETPLPNAAPACLPLGAKIHHLPTHKTDNSESNTTTKSDHIGPRTAESVTSALQTKGTAYLARTLSSTLHLSNRPTRHVILVASLVDNPYNLGGLSRVGEVFGASALTLQNQNVLGNKDFLSVSVSSHLHFPIVQLSASGIPEFLAERKAEGYKVVGIEQTDRSVVLGSPEALLPERCVLVVGSEREGIPARVLVECDVLVEIPQVGVTRSLNVQTAVAVAMFEYGRQYPQ